jgi:hypothetical protein
MQNVIRLKNLIVWAFWFLALPFFLGVWFLFFHQRYNLLVITLLMHLSLSGHIIAFRQKQQGHSYKLYLLFLLIPVGLALALCFFFAWLMFHSSH